MTRPPCNRIASARVRGTWTVVKHALHLVLGLGILALGVRGIAAPYL
ncbi:hypothetical protein [Streptomyces sp.]|nr:hypothetical protein [Streptomyces sp.]